MSAAKHSPGPWSYNASTGYVYTNSGDTVCDSYEFFDKEQSDINGRLISAAPALLEAATMGHRDSSGLPAGDLLAAANVLRNHGHDDLAARLEAKHTTEQAAIAKTTANWEGTQ